MAGHHGTTGPGLEGGTRWTNSYCDSHGASHQPVMSNTILNQRLSFLFAFLTSLLQILKLSKMSFIFQTKIYEKKLKSRFLNQIKESIYLVKFRVKI